MVEIAEIVDRESFEAWLRQEDLPREAMVALAHRAAMRVLPLALSSLPPNQAQRDSELLMLQVWRTSVLSLAGAFEITNELREIAYKSSSWSYGYSTISDLPPAIASFRSAARAVFSGQAMDAVAASSAELWRALREDSWRVDHVYTLMGQPLWIEQENPFKSDWMSAKELFRRCADPKAWTFWIEFYDLALKGSEDRWSLLQDIALLDKDEKRRDIWENPERVATEIARLEAEYEARTITPSAPMPADLAIADFTFDTLHKWMLAVGFQGDLAHIKDPALVEQFNDEIDELRDDLRDIEDYSADLTGPTNQPAYLATAVSKLLREVDTAKQKGHIRARRIVKLGHDLGDFLNNETALAEIGDGLTRQLVDATALLKGICRTHFAPRLVVVDALCGIELEGADPDEVVALLETALERIEASDGSYFAPLRREDTALLRDMLDELRGVDASIDEAQTDKHRERQKKKFASGAAQLTATLGGYATKAAKHGKTAGAALDKTDKWKKRWATLEPVVDVLRDLVQWLGGAPPT